MPALNLEKFANAFVPHAVPTAAVGGAARNATDRFAARNGGLWVGAKVTATVDGPHFAANAMNKAFHVGLEETWIPLADIRSVTRGFGGVSGIVVVRHAEGEFRFRCFGAKGVAAHLASGSS